MIFVFNFPDSEKKIIVQLFDRVGPFFLFEKETFQVETSKCGLIVTSGRFET